MIINWPDCGKGVNKDLMPEELGLGVWTDCKNMRFGKGFAERFGGMANVFSPTSVTPYHLAYYKSQSGSRYWIHSGIQHVYADDGYTRNEITPGSYTFTGAIDDRWSSGTFNGFHVCTNGVDEPHYWDGNTSNNLAKLPGWTSTWRCKAIVPFKDYIVALNISKGANTYTSMVKWSAAAVPGAMPTSWDETDVTKDAGEVDLAETPDNIVDAMQLGDSLVIYKQRSIYLMSFIGQPYIFRFQKLPFEYGLLAKGCVADTPVGHVVLTNGDVVLHSGQAPQSIADGTVRDYIFRNISNTKYERSFVCTNSQKYEVLICFPTEGSDTCNKAAVWNWKEGTWGFRDLTDVTYGTNGLIAEDYSLEQWAGDSGSWQTDATIWNENEYSSSLDRLIFSRVGNISAFDVGLTDFGVDFESYLERIGLSFDDGQAVKMLRCIWPRIDGVAGTEIEFEIGATMSPVQAATFQNATTFTIGTDFKSDGFATGRFMSVRIKNTDSKYWRMKSIDFDVTQAGVY